MKTLKLTSLLAGTALVATAVFTASCSNDVAEPQALSASNQPISFRVQGGIKKTTATTTDYLNAFVVRGDDYEGTTLLSTPLNAVTVYRLEGVNNAWDYNPKGYYNHAADNAEFFAYSPVSKYVSNGLGGVVDDKKLVYEVPEVTADGNTSQEDFLLAYKKETTLSASPVALQFKHALSRVFVSATNTTSSDVVINQIALLNLNSVGTLDYDSDPTAFTDTDIKWTFTNDPAEDKPLNYFYQLPASGVVLKASAPTTLITSVEQGMMVMPQSTTVGAATTYKTYTPTPAPNPGIGNTGADDDIDDEDNFYLAIEYTLANAHNIVYVPATTGLVFEPNKQYNLIVKFTGTEITFDPVVGDFTPDIVPGEDTDLMP